jgi:organic radical activating enzyme
MFNLESFCGELWSQIEINTLGDYKICCLANYAKDYGMAQDKDGKVMNVLTHSIEEAMNSETHKAHRLELKQNIKVQRCRNCYDSEDSTKGISDWGDENNHVKKWGRSKRQRVNVVTSKEIPEYITWDRADQYTLPDGSITSKVVNLGLRFGNLCNQKCIMCSAEFSSLWYDDHVALYGIDKPVGVGGYTNYNIIKDARGKNTLDFAKWWESPIWWERFESIAPSLKHLYLTGGEPLVVPALQEMLDRLITKDFAKDITLRFDTNLSAINKKVIEKFKHFKKINFCVSMDDTGDRYGLIRFPGSYDNLVANIKQVQDSGLGVHYLSCCMGIASIYAPIRIGEIAEQLSVNAEFRFLEGPDWHDLRSLPRSAKQEIIDTYKGLMHHSESRTKWYKATIKFLEKYMDQERISDLEKFVATMDKLDKIRGTDWRTVLPDVQDILARHCPNIGA